jgi:hypothetical protein
MTQHATTPLADPSSDSRRKALSVLVGLVVTLLLGWGLWSLYSYLVGDGSTPSGDAVLVPDLGGRPRTRDGGRPDFRRLAQPPVVTDGVREVLANTFLVRQKGSLARLTRQADGTWAIRFGYDRSDLLPDEQRRALRAAYDAIGRRGIADQLKLTPEQLTKLRELGPDPGMVVTDEDRAAFLELWSKYYATPEAERPSMAPQLLSLLEQIGNRGLEPTRSALADRATKAMNILTPEQVQQWLTLVQQQRGR